MARKMFVNLPVKDLKKTIAFFTALGFEFNAQFTDENATCMIVSEEAYVMLLVEKRFKDFTKKDIVDSSKQTEAIIALSADSREEVDSIANKAIAAGGSESNKAQDHGFMYVRSFQDVDGHLWEILWMDPSFVQK